MGMAVVETPAAVSLVGAMEHQIQMLATDQGAEANSLVATVIYEVFQMLVSSVLRCSN